MNHLVSLSQNENGEDLTADWDGNPVPRVWHLLWNTGGSPSLFCSGEVFGCGEGNAIGETKSVALGGINCPSCLSMIKEIKAVKL
jgi:hypothetical protein